MVESSIVAWRPLQFKQHLRIYVDSAKSQSGKREAIHKIGT